MKYFRIFKKSISFSIAQATIFRTSFVVFFVWLLLDTLIKVFFFKAIFAQVDSIGGWSFNDCFILVALQGLMYDFAWMFFLAGLEKFVDNFSTGAFDFVLTKPMHPLTYITLTGFSASSFSGTRIPLLAYALIAFPLFLATPNVLAAMLFFVAGLVALHAFFSITSTICFYLVEGDYAMDLSFNLIEGGRMPLTIFPLAMRILFTFFIPVFFVTSFPLMALKNMINLNYSLLAVLVAIVLELVAYKVWNIAIKHYSSASS